MVGKQRKKVKLIYNQFLESLDTNMSASNEGDYERRTISIAPAIHAALQDFRGKLIQERNDVDYTTLVNYVLAYGIRFVDKHQANRTPEDDEFVNKLVGNRFRLAEISLGDEYENIYRLKQQDDSDSEESSA